MKIVDLLALLNDLPVNALDKHIFTSGDVPFVDVRIVPVVTQGEEVIMYAFEEVIPLDPKQLNLPFGS